MLRRTFLSTSMFALAAGCSFGGGGLSGTPKPVMMRSYDLRDLRFGAVEITVHNAQVVQIERKEKFRLQNPSSKPS